MRDLPVSPRRLPKFLNAALLALLTGAAAVPCPASAFCGFFVSGATDDLANSASQVVLLRSGNHTVMSMSNNYKGPPQNFAMVVPVPVVLKKEQVKTLDPDVLRRLDQLSAPRLVEYWEQDPCLGGGGTGEGTIGLGGLGAIGFGAGGGGTGGYGVKIEAQFAVGEYQIVILSAQESNGLEKWLHENGYKIPAGAAAALAPYIRDQMKFFVAKVDIAKVKRDSHGVIVLSPLRFSYDAAELRLPVRLGLLNASGAQDLLVYVLHESQRFEVANYKNVYIPTNLEVTDSVRQKFPAFYAELFDSTLRASGGAAVVTEYAWQTTSCDPCPIPPLSPIDMATLGASEAPGGVVTPTVPEVNVGEVQVQGALDKEVVRRIVRRHIGELRFCYEKAAAHGPNVNVAGKATLVLSVTDSGQVDRSEVVQSTLGDEGLELCLTNGARRWEFPKGATKVTQPLVLGRVPQRLVYRGGPVGPSYVLTRLHTRYDRRALSEDLLFRAASPISGGRATWPNAEDTQPQVEKATINNFQARYIMRHYWEGKIACDKPHYGIWGGLPLGPQPVRSGGVQTGTDLANAPRSQVSLREVIRSPVPVLDLPGNPRPLRPGESPRGH